MTPGAIHAVLALVLIQTRYIAVTSAFLDYRVLGLRMSSANDSSCLANMLLAKQLHRLSLVLLPLRAMQVA